MQSMLGEQGFRRLASCRPAAVWLPWGTITKKWDKSKSFHEDEVNPSFKLSLFWESCLSLAAFTSCAAFTLDGWYAPWMPYLLLRFSFVPGRCYVLCTRRRVSAAWREIYSQQLPSSGSHSLRRMPIQNDFTPEMLAYILFEGNMSTKYTMLCLRAASFLLFLSQVCNIVPFQLPCLPKLWALLTNGLLEREGQWTPSGRKAGITDPVISL